MTKTQLMESLLQRKPEDISSKEFQEILKDIVKLLPDDLPNADGDMITFSVGDAVILYPEYQNSDALGRVVYTVEATGWQSSGTPFLNLVGKKGRYNANRFERYVPTKESRELGFVIGDYVKLIDRFQDMYSIGSSVNKVERLEKIGSKTLVYLEGQTYGFFAERFVCVGSSISAQGKTLICVGDYVRQKESWCVPLYQNVYIVKAIKSGKVTFLGLDEREFPLSIFTRVKVIDG